MRFDIRYRTLFTYEQLVRESHNELRACPSGDFGDQVVAYRVNTHPRARVVSFIDYWGTRVDAFGIREPHITLEVVAEATVNTREPVLVTAAPGFDEVTDPAFAEPFIEFLVVSAHTECGPRVEALAKRTADMAGNDVVSAVLAVHRQVHGALQYLPGATEIGVSAEEVLGRGAGVCQDYAHVAVAVCRALKIPARYVSGYFFAQSDRTGAVTEATDAVHVQTHAWFEAMIPGHGWLALDPTNSLQVGTRHVAIGRGREYDDVAPFRGVYRGAGVAAVEAGVEIRKGLLQQQMQSQQ